MTVNTPAQKVLGAILKTGSEVALRSLRESYPDPKVIPACDELTRGIFKVLYDGGAVDLATLDLRTGGCYHDALEQVVSKAEDGWLEQGLAELQRETQKQRSLAALNEALYKIEAGLVEPAMAMASLADLSREMAPRSNAEGWSEQATRATQEMMAQANEPDRLTLGVGDFDGLFRFRRGNLVTVAAPTSHGKTSFATRMTCRALQAGLRVAYLCFEDYHVFPLKVASALYEVPLQHFTRYDLALEADRERAEQALELCEQYKDNLLVVPDMRLSEFSAIARRHKADLVVFDYVQKYAERYGQDDRRGACSKATSEFQDLARELRAYSLMPCQIRRRELAKIDRGSGTGLLRKPGLSDLKESGDIENYSDAVILLWWPWKDAMEDEARKLDMQAYHILVAKDKLGEGGERQVRFDGSTATFKARYSLPQ